MNFYQKYDMKKKYLVTVGEDESNKITLKYN
jgi:hypothetical protein